MVVNSRSGFRLGGRNDGLGALGFGMTVGVRASHPPPPVRSPFGFLRG